jgi:methyl-accepting chemotaxis protein
MLKFLKGRNAVAALVVIAAALSLGVALPLVAPFPGWAAGLVALSLGLIAGSLGRLGHGANRDELVSIQTGIGAARRGERPSRPAELSGELNELLGALDTVADDVQTRSRRLKDAESKRDELSAEVDERDRRLGQAVRGLDVLVDELSTALHEQTSTIEHLSGSVEATSGADHAARTVDLALETERGAESVQRVVEELARLAQSSSRATALLTALHARTEKMREAVADADRAIRQAGVVAINVEILAGNAGDAARGFEVAGQEIKELTDRAGDGARVLTQLLDTTANETRGAEAALATELSGIERATRAGAEAERVLRDIAALHRAQPERAGAWREAAALVERIRELAHTHERRAAALAETLERLRAPSPEPDGKA